MSSRGKNFKKLFPSGSFPMIKSTDKANYLPLKWQDYFDSEEFVQTPSGKHHIYVKGSDSKGPILLCLHGGGYNGLTWALFAKEIHQELDCEIIAIDFRGHGNTTTDNEEDLSMETLTQDVVYIADTLAKRKKKKIVLIGHSMGGAIAVNASYSIEGLLALCVIDVVEGSALEALSSMHNILRGRPTKFDNIPQAIQWCCKGQNRNLEAARVSMPGQIMNSKTKVLACDEWESFHEISVTNTVAGPSTSNPKRVLEETDEESSEDLFEPRYPDYDTWKEFKEKESPDPPKRNKPDIHYLWRIDLKKTEPYWEHWFEGLSDKFLGSKVPKILLLANIHGLDTKLTIGQMQGKFQLQVLTKSGHAVHEDQPQKVAQILSVFLEKQKCAEIKADSAASKYPGICG